MANPQKEDGFTAIANELMEALMRTRIPGEARQVFDAILRKTYGFNKKRDAIAGSQFTEMTGLDRRIVYKARKRLLAMNMITVTQKGDSQILTYAVQKDYTKWQLSPKKVTVTKLVTPVTQKGDGLSPNSPHTKDTTKDTLQKTYMRESVKKPTDPRVKEFIDYHFQNHQKHGKGPYIVKGKKDGGLVKKLLSALDLETLKGFDDDLFTTEDEFVREAGYTIGVLYSVIGKLQAARAASLPSFKDPRQEALNRQAREETELVERLNAENAPTKN